jgi:ferredoxin-NADP reductase
MEETRFVATLSEKKEIAKNILELRFTKPEGFSYQAGQFVQFYIPQAEKPVLRSYSISSIPTDPYLEFCIKILDGGIASEHVSQMSVGDTLEFRGPKGRFIVEENEHDHYFVATGVGLAPIMGMLRQLAISKESSQPARLLFGVRSEEDLFWVERLDALKETFPLFEYAVTLSQPKPTGGWQGLKGRVTDHLLHHHMKHRFYLCGSADMVKDVRSLLIEHGTEARAIHFEIF